MTTGEWKEVQLGAMGAFKPLFMVGTTTGRLSYSSKMVKVLI